MVPSHVQGIYGILENRRGLKKCYMCFSNSLIIHKEKTKEITTVTVVWIPDLN